MSLRSRAIIATIRAANRLRARQSLKAIKGHTLRVKGKKTELKHGTQFQIHASYIYLKNKKNRRSNNFGIKNVNLSR